jgi:hypothetical protein
LSASGPAERSERGPISIAARRAALSGRLALLVALGLAPLADRAPAQPKRERRTHTWVMELRLQVWEECRSQLEARPELLAQVAAELASESRGNPLLPLARALARARGVAADAAFELRAGVQCLASPEVVDGERYPHVALTMHTPYRLSFEGAVAFRLRVLDDAGEVVWRGDIAHDTAPDDLTRFRATVQVPVAEWPDGAYRVEAELLLDGAGPRAADPRSRARFCVRRGFPAAVQALQRRAAELSRAAAPGALAAVHGAMAELHGLYAGEPRRGQGTAGADLERARAILDNVAEGREPLAGLRGWADLAVATGAGEAVEVSVRLPADGADASPPPRPLLLVVPGSPTWDGGWSRPTSPASASPHWLRDALEAFDFDREQRCVLAVMESPGRVRELDGAIAAVVAHLREGFGAGDELLLVGEREGASAVTRALSLGVVRAGAIAQACGG